MEQERNLNVLDTIVYDTKVNFNLLTLKKIVIYAPFIIVGVNLLMSLIGLILILAGGNGKIYTPGILWVVLAVAVLIKSKAQLSINLAAEGLEMICVTGKATKTKVHKFLMNSSDVRKVTYNSKSDKIILEGNVLIIRPNGKQVNHKDTIIYCNGNSERILSKISNGWGIPVHTK